MFHTGFSELLIIGLVIVLPFWKIFSKAGYSPWLSLTMVIPLVNIIMLFYLAFAVWPISRGINRIPRAPGDDMV
jgi:uncharacterized protein (DUF983 family)